MAYPARGTLLALPQCLASVSGNELSPRTQACKQVAYIGEGGGNQHVNVTSTRDKLHVRQRHKHARQNTCPAALRRKAARNTVRDCAARACGEVGLELKYEQANLMYACVYCEAIK